MKDRIVVFAFATLSTVLCGGSLARPSSPLSMRAFSSVALAGVPAPPMQPKPFAVPAQPIMPASSDGYLPMSWSVTPKGEFTLALPLAVPPGRAGMEPALSLSYASSTGNGIAGVGWSVSGFSTITRGGRVWARDGAMDSADFSERDRFYLDGQELVGVNATPYGGNGAEYRTEPDTFVRVRSTSELPLDPKGPDAFTVELGDGRSRTYAAVEAQQITFDHDNKVFASAPVRVAWHLSSEQDASGNTVSYEYEDFSGPGGSNASDYWYEERPSKIFYTANLTQGVPTHGLQDLPERYVAFEYEDRPDVSAGWTAGVQWRHGTRLKTIAMYAPNPTATSRVWQYDLSYAVSGSQRSLLSAVQRCEAIGGCLWAKDFSYSLSGNGVGFQSQPLLPAPIKKTDYDLGLVGAADGEVPALQLLDLNGDSASDLLFGPGATKLWETKYYGDPFYVSLPDGKFLGGGHSVWLSQRDANGAIVPLSQGLSLPRDETPLASAKYGHVRLDAATGVDLDGDGHDELVATIDNLGAHEVNVDPNLPPLYDCSFAEMKWTGAGFVHTHAVPCTPLGDTNGAYKYYLPNEFPTFADFNGDGLVDRAAPYNAGGWVGANNPNDPEQLEFSPAWQVALNMTGTPGQFFPPVKYGQVEASPGVVTDLNGDGRPELTSEAVQSSLTLDDDGQWSLLAPDSVHMRLDAQAKPLEGYREFGDFNGDGSEDELQLTRADSKHPELLTGQIFWNTGRGSYADPHTLTVPVDVHPDVAMALPTRFADPGIHVTDVNNDGRMDLVVFNNDHTYANQQPAPQILLLLSAGDGTFSEVPLAVQAGTRDDVKYRFDNALRSITFDPVALENDQTRLGLEAFGQVIPGAQVLLDLVPFQDYVRVGSDYKTPGLAAGWNLATLADVNGDGAIDIIRHVGGNDPAGGFEVLQGTPQDGDELMTVSDEFTAWPALSVSYSNEWSDRPEVNDSYACAYPLHCPKSGLRVVREVTSRAGLFDLPFGADPLKRGHTWRYSYRDPVANVRGLGFFGFSEVRVWDTAPEHPVETITTFDLRTSGPKEYYPGVGVPATVTVAQPILAPGQGKPAQAPARITRTSYAYEVRSLNNGATHAVFPASSHTSQWEEPVAMFWSGQGPDHTHVAGYAEPAAPPIHVDTDMTYDDYGNVVDTVTETVKGRRTEVQTPRINDAVSWHLGLISQRAVMTLESEKNAVPVWRTTDYTYTSQGQLETITVEPNAADPTLTAETALGYDDYGLLTSTTTKVPNEASRTSHIEYTNAWPGAPDEHLYASAVWAEHDNPSCVSDCRPAAWMLIHPAYGVPIASMGVEGVQTVRTYDGHGRALSAQTDGVLPVSVTYSGRTDDFGGVNGLQTLTTSGLQQVLQTFNARGAPLRSSTVGFDGQWVNTFATYDDLGRRTALSRPKSAGAPTDWTSYAYDSLGRTVATTFPDTNSATSVYGMLETEHTDPAGHYSYQRYDVDGRLITSGAQVPPVPGCNGVCLAQDIKTTYQYSATPLGALTRVLDDQGNLTQTQYDRRGRPIQQDDPSRGVTTVTYNGWSESKETVHVASGQTQTQTYDDLGRVLTMTTPDGLTTYSWDVANNGVGRLARAVSPDQIRTEYRYDALGRTMGIDQTDELAHTASVDFHYDPQTGRLANIDYPLAPGQGARVRVAYGYNGYGYLTSVSNATPNQPAQVLQQITARNADLALVDAVRGGGVLADHRDYDPLMGRLWTIGTTEAGANRLNVDYDYDADGLVRQRTLTDDVVQIDESFEHDALHRLTHVVRNGMPLHVGVPFSTSLDESYDSVGNRIDTRRNGQLIEHRSYGSNGQQPYALTQRDLTDPNQPPQSVQYQYDTLGRLHQDPHRTLTWNAFDLPQTVIEDGQLWTFGYDAGGARVRKKGPGETTTSLAGLYEKRETSATTQHVFHVIGSEAPIADITYTEAPLPSSPGTFDVQYPLTDALGTTYAVADASGTVLEHDYYDAWGLRSNADGTPLANLTLFHSLSTAGFTSHEHDDGLALINMQGRMYDPVLGRFLSPDPLVGSPAFSQSWNAYSYVLNSPINFTDPSGFDCSAAQAVASGSEKGFIATGQCSASSNYTLANGDEASVDDASRVPDISSTFSSAMAFQADMKKIAKLQHNLKAAMSAQLDFNRPRSADGTPIATGKDSWGWSVQRNRGGTGLAPPSPRSLYEAKVIAQGGSFNPDHSFAGFGRGKLPIDTDMMVEGLVASESAAAKLSFEAVHTLDTVLDKRVSFWKKLRKVNRLFNRTHDYFNPEPQPDVGSRPGPMGMAANDPPRRPTLELLPPGEGDDFELTPEEELEVFRGEYNDALDQFGFYANEIASLQQAGLTQDRYGVPLWQLEQHKKSWGKALDEAGEALKAAEAKIKKKP